MCFLFVHCKRQMNYLPQQTFLAKYRLHLFSLVANILIQFIFARRKPFFWCQISLNIKEKTSRQFAIFCYHNGYVVYIIGFKSHTGLTYLRYDDCSACLSDKNNIGTLLLYERNESGMNTITKCYSDLLNNSQNHNLGHTARFKFTKIFIIKDSTVPAIILIRRQITR